MVSKNKKCFLFRTTFCIFFLSMNKNIRSNFKYKRCLSLSSYGTSPTFFLGLSLARIRNSFGNLQIYFMEVVSFYEPVLAQDVCDSSGESMEWSGTGWLAPELRISIPDRSRLLAQLLSRRRSLDQTTPRPTKYGLSSSAKPCPS